MHGILRFVEPNLFPPRVDIAFREALCHVRLQPVVRYLLLFVALDSDRLPRRVPEALLRPLALVVVVSAAVAHQRGLVAHVPQEDVVLLYHFDHRFRSRRLNLWSKWYSTPRRRSLGLRPCGLGTSELRRGLQIVWLGAPISVSRRHGMLQPNFKFSRYTHHAKAKFPNNTFPVELASSASKRPLAKTQGPPRPPKTPSLRFILEDLELEGRNTAWYYRLTALRRSQIDWIGAPEIILHVGLVFSMGGEMDRWIMPDRRWWGLGLAAIIGFTAVREKYYPGKMGLELGKSIT
ncbi:hypothetical protein GGX14DRAFT_653519 [Mycena pura]|uniref:Uncharacterized protein n=1 Tax=Mycena pura TaxID=153505 RepID=A0AAD6YAV2_9AGAR|nr:hypothetical protein GGX14DRAFT_653519 [Mycena pura]